MKPVWDTQTRAEELESGSSTPLLRKDNNDDD